MIIVSDLILKKTNPALNIIQNWPLKLHTPCQICMRVPISSNFPALVIIIILCFANLIVESIFIFLVFDEV